MRKAGGIPRRGGLAGFNPGGLAGFNPGGLARATPAAMVRAGILGLLLLGNGGPGEAEEPTFEFLRVHVPRARIGDVPLGDGRYVPMAVGEFDTLVARATAPRAAPGTRPQPLLPSARYSAALDGDGRLVGTLTCELPADQAATLPAVPLGRLGVVTDRDDGEQRTDVFGTDNDGLYLRTPTAGRYECRFALDPAGPGHFVLPLVPAITSSLALSLPSDLRPVTTDPTSLIVPPSGTGSATWLVEVGPATEIDVRLLPRDRPPAPARCWTAILLRGPDAEFTTTLVPEGPWQDRVVLEKDRDAVIVAVETEAGDPLAWQEKADTSLVTVTLPHAAGGLARHPVAGSTTPLRVRGITPTPGAALRLPSLRLPAAVWAGGGMVVRLDPTLAVAAIELADCRVITPEATAAWPLPRPPAASPSLPPVRSAVIHLEQETAGATAHVTLKSRTPTFDVARVTTVEISPEAVLGRAVCDVRVADGETFELVGRLAPGWIVDSVEAAIWPRNAEPRIAAGREAAGGSDVRCEWRTIRSPTMNMLRIALPVPVSPEVIAGLWIRGHRPRIPSGTGFSTADIDMVRLPGESVESTLVDFKVGPDAVVEIDGEPASWLRAHGRLAALVEDGTLRARIRGSDQAPDREARVVQRRPPLDATVEVRLDVRDELLVESFTFECRPEAGGIDAIVVHFSEPMGEPLVWSAVTPADLAISARRIEGPRDTSGQIPGPIAESWLVECTPPITGPLTIRAVRTLPFMGALPVPLAWIEGDTAPGGTVVLSAVGGPRPDLVSRRLRELPVPADLVGTGNNRGEFAFGPPESDSEGLPAADIVPAAAPADARGWAWREDVACWCEESGGVECESRFDLENHGRSSLAVTVPAGRTVERVLVDGVAVPMDAAEAAGPTLRVPLPPGGRRVELAVRTRSAEDPRKGFWLIDPIGCSVDVPVLDRDVRLRLPPGLDASWANLPGGAYREVQTADRGWIDRLVGPAWREPAPGDTAAAGAPAQANTAGTPPQGDTAAAGPDSVAGGFRERRFIVTSRRQPGSGILVVRRRLIGSITILTAAAAAFATLLTSRRLRLATTICVGLAVAALWAPVPFDIVPRVALWAAVVSLLVGRLAIWLDAVGTAPAIARGPRAAAARGAVTAMAAGLAMTAGRTSAAEPFRVFIDQAADGPLALVPEPLYRLLADAAVPEAAGVRVLECAISVTGSFDADPWQLELDVDADAGGMLTLEQAPGRAVWIAPDPAAVPQGVRIRVEGSRLRLSAATEGRRRVTVGVVPAVTRRGALETASIRMPTVPRAGIVFLDAAGTPVTPPLGGIACDRASETGPWLPVEADPATDGGRGRPTFDVSGARRVRLVRPIDPRQRIAAEPPGSRGTNDVTWESDGCRVEATLELDGGPDVVRWFVATVDERFGDLEPRQTDGAPPRLTRLDPTRVLVEPREAVTGVQRVVIAGRIPLADPVGTFTVPTIWPESAADADRTLRLTAAAGFDATLEPGPRRVTVRRRREPPRGQQNLLVDLAADRTLLTLTALIETGGSPLMVLPIQVPAESVVDRVAMTLDDAGGASWRPVDVTWTRTATERIDVVLQQPRAGRFRLVVEARLPTPPSRRGAMPLVRALPGDATPLLVTWQSEPTLGLRVTRDPDAPDDGDPLASIELLPEAPPPTYRLAPRRDRDGRTVDAEDQRPAVRDVAPVASGLARTEVFIGIDRRGRTRGLVRFDLTSDQPIIRLRLPPPMRLFDVLVDGQEVPASARENNAWDVRLQTAAWPRTVLAVFVGDLGDGFVAGAPVRLDPPGIEGFPGGAVWWTIVPPEGLSLGVSPPAERLEREDLEAARGAVRQGLDAIFDRALEAAAEPERQRLRTLADLRRVGATLPREATWLRALGWPDGTATEAARTLHHAAVGDEGGLTLRAVRAVDRNASERAVVTAALILACGVAWAAGGRRAATAAS